MDFSKCWCTDNNGYPAFDEDVKRYTDVRPSERQLAFNELKYYNFIHFGINTFTDREWGDGTEDEKLFNPTELDTDQWCDVLKKSGSKGIIFTAKHHDGFCLFDSKYTTHSVIKSPYGKDIVKELALSCKKYDLKLGLYLSPWDRHEKKYGTPEYNDYFVNQLTELCTNYGELFCLWFDGACGEGKNGKKQVYDWNRYFSVIRKYQPNAVIAICGPDVRWIGNEGGKVRTSEWSVIPWTNDTLEKVAENSQKNENETDKMASFEATDEDLGSRAIISNKVDLRWSPAEADVSITYGWFYHDDEYYKNDKRGASRTPEALAQIFMSTVGGNASMLLNVPPDKKGLISHREIKTLSGFTDIMHNKFKNEIPAKITLVTKDGTERPLTVNGFMIQNDESAIKITSSQKIRTMFIDEDIKYSQRIEAFDVYVDGEKTESCTTIGSGKILSFPMGAKEIVIIIRQSRGNPVIKSVNVFQ